MDRVSELLRSADYVGMCVGMGGWRPEDSSARHDAQQRSIGATTKESPPRGRETSNSVDSAAWLLLTICTVSQVRAVGDGQKAMELDG